jgi:hypothetical protein
MSTSKGPRSRSKSKGIELRDDASDILSEDERRTGSAQIAESPRPMVGDQAIVKVRAERGWRKSVRHSDCGTKIMLQAQEQKQSR